MSDDRSSDVLIVGAGISGLATAWGLQRRGHKVSVIEAAPRPGGAIGSLRQEGCLIESGPNSTLETSPLIGALLDELGIAAERIGARPAAAKRYVLRGGRLVALPLSLPAFVTTPLFSWRAKLSLLREPFLPRLQGEGEETVADFVRRRLGSEFLDYAIDPFVAGVYAGDPEHLSLRAAFPRLQELERRYGSLIRGQIFGARERRRSQEKSKQAAPMISLRNGMQTLTDAIATRLDRLVLDTSAISAARDGQGGWQVAARGPGGHIAHYRARVLVLATPAFAAAELVVPHGANAARALDGISYPPVASVASAYDRADIAHALDGFGFLVPRKEQRGILGTIFSSTLFDNRAPETTALLTSFVGGMRQPEVAQDDETRIARTVQTEHSALLGARRQARWTRVTRWPRAIPQYALGHLDRMAALDAAERDLPGLFFCANYRGGIAVGDCIRSAHAMAQRVAAYLG